MSMTKYPNIPYDVDDDEKLRETTTMHAFMLKVLQMNRINAKTCYRIFFIALTRLTIWLKYN